MLGGRRGLWGTRVDMVMPKRGGGHVVNLGGADARYWRRATHASVVDTPFARGPATVDGGLHRSSQGPRFCPRSGIILAMPG